MSDQAAGLRRLMRQGQPFQPVGVFGTDAALSASVSAHLALALVRRGTPTWVLDEAAAPRNVVTQFGIQPRFTLDQALRRQADAAAAVTPVLDGLHVLALHGGMGWLAGIPELRWRTAVDDLAAMPGQPLWLVLHAPAGRERDSLALCAQERLLVMPQRKTALTQTYALLKAAHQHHPADRYRVLVVQARDEDAAGEAFDALAATARRFLGIRLDSLGWIPRDVTLADAARRLRSICELPPGTPGMQAFRQLAERFVARMADEGSHGMEEFWLKTWMFSRLAAEAALEDVQNVQPSRSLG